MKLFLIFFLGIAIGAFLGVILMALLQINDLTE